MLVCDVIPGGVVHTYLVSVSGLYFRRARERESGRFTEQWIEPCGLRRQLWLPGIDVDMQKQPMLPGGGGVTCRIY